MCGGKNLLRIYELIIFWPVCRYPLKNSSLELAPVIKCPLSSKQVASKILNRTGSTSSRGRASTSRQSHAANAVHAGRGANCGQTHTSVNQNVAQRCASLVRGAVQRTFDATRKVFSEGKLTSLRLARSSCSVGVINCLFSSCSSRCN